MLCREKKNSVFTICKKENFSFDNGRTHNISPGKWGVDIFLRNRPLDTKDLQENNKDEVKVITT